MVFVPKYILILFFLIILDYFLALRIEKGEGNKKLFLFVSIIANIGVLFFFKYFNFFNENVATLATFLHWNYKPFILSVLLPLGLSFHIFQSLSYVIDVYNKKVLAEKKFFNYALYVLFFPQLVAGPIERAAHLLPQIEKKHFFDKVLFINGLERILFGFFKKLVIADQIASVINPIFAAPPANPLLLLIISALFLYQLYCDFSGYTDIALGSAMLLGFSLRENFNRPFAARSVTEFWQRWHMSLSSWLKDYLYYPLILSLGSINKIKIYISTFVTFVLIGLWHGANWTYIAFGALHGVYLIVEASTKELRRFMVKITRIEAFPRIHYIFQVVLVFFLVMVSLIFFRSESVTKAFWIIFNIFNVSNFTFNTHEIYSILTFVPGNIVFLYIFISIAVMEVVQYFQEKKETYFIFEDKSMRYAWCYFLIMSLLFFGRFSSESFIYFQF
jgi:D-alanyl-lipoteichoic acid acyltransferase DltB (MBOAT superfamily)